MDETMRRTIEDARLHAKLANPRRAGDRDLFTRCADLLAESARLIDEARAAGEESGRGDMEFFERKWRADERAKAVEAVYRLVAAKAYTPTVLDDDACVVNDSDLHKLTARWKSMP